MNVCYRFGDCVLDIAKRELRRDGRIEPLPGKVFECLRHLVEHRDRAIGRDELGQAAFGRIDVTDAHLGQVILRARRAVGDDGHEQRMIRTIPRFGFRWAVDTQVWRERPGTEGEETVGYDVRGEGRSEHGFATDPAGPITVGATHEAHCEPHGSFILPPQEPPSASSDLGVIASPDPHEGGTAVKTLPAPVAQPWTRLWWAVSAAIVIGVASVAITRTTTAPATASSLSRVSGSALVLPAEVQGPEEAAWTRLGLMAFVAERVRRAGITVVPNENTLSLLGRAGASRPSAQWLRQAANVDLIIDARIVRDGDAWKLSVGATDGHGVRRQGDARGPDLLQAARIASDRLLAALGRTAADRGDADLDLAERIQRAEAARLANELDAAKEILLAAPPTQRNAPRLRYELAQVYTRGGDFAQAMATLVPLFTDASVIADPVFHARILCARGQVHMRQAHIAQAEQDFDASVQLLDPDRHHAELGRALTYRGVTRSGLGAFDEALADLGQARIHLLRAHDALAVARVDGNLGVLELNRGRPGYALDYLRKAATVFESFGAVQELLITRSHVLQVHLMQLQYGEAWTRSEQDFAMRDRARDPGQRLSINLDRAEILIRLGRFGQARTVLDDPSVAAVGAQVNERRRAYVRIEHAWRRGDLRDALRRADAVLAGWSEEAWDSTRAWVLLRRQQAALALGVAPLPMPVASTDVDTPTTGDQGSAVPDLLSRATARRAAGDDAEADRLYTEAISLAERRGMPFEISAAAAAYAPWLIERGRLAVAGALVGRVGLWADRDYECALLQLRLYHALGHRELWFSALETARQLAGERPIPVALTQVPRISSSNTPEQIAISD